MFTSQRSTQHNADGDVATTRHGPDVLGRDTLPAVRSSSAPGSAARKTAGLSQPARGAAVGLSYQQIQKFERGANRITVAMLVKLSRTQNVPISDLLIGLEP